MIRPNVLAMAGYTPGEQPRDDGFIKLNTNENPYAPSPRVIDAIRTALVPDRLRKYPDPSGTAFRHAAANLHGVDPDGILIGNGSDDILTIVTRAAVPQGGAIAAPMPGYLLYRTLAEIQGARFVPVPFTANWELPVHWPTTTDLTLIANPNSPSGTTVSRDRLERLAGEVGGLLVVDEAYVDFAETDAIELSRLANVVITRTLSKSYALAGVRFGYAVARPELIRELCKVKDSYNCDVLSLVAATAAIEDQDYLAQCVSRIRATRERLRIALADLGFAVTPSATNFLWCRHPSANHRGTYEALKARRILVRYMDYPGFGDGLRITVGTDAEVDRLLDELRTLV